MRKFVLLAVLSSGAIVAAAGKPASFLGRRDYYTGGGVVAVADVNGDNLPDLILVSPDSGGGVTVLINTLGCNILLDLTNSPKTLSVDHSLCEFVAS